MTSRTRVKICGITRPQDAQLAAYLGVDAIGLVFYAKSPRAVTLTQACAIMQALPPFVTIVGLFVNPTSEEVHDILAQLPIDVLQFHGEEPANYCANFNKPYIKAIRMRAGIDIHSYIQQYATAQALLLDSYVPGTKGGTGTTFDWQRIPAHLSKPIIVAGGLTADNVAQVITTIHPYAVDVSGGVETAKGIKNADKMTAFMQECFHVNG